jgi:hypothetical protein
VFKGLYVKISTYLRAYRRVFLPGCQELLEASLYSSETTQILGSAKGLETDVGYSFGASYAAQWLTTPQNTRLLRTPTRE